MEAIFRYRDDMGGGGELEFPPEKHVRLLDFHNFL